MRKDIFLPVLALAGGAVGFLLRLWQYASAYDPATELFAHGAPAIHYYTMGKADNIREVLKRAF